MAPLAALALLSAVTATNPQARADFVLGNAANYLILAEAGVTTVAVDNSHTNGNIGIGGQNTVLALQTNGFVSGRADFAGTTANVTGTASNISGGTQTGVSAVTAALTTTDALNSTSNTNATTGTVAPTVNLNAGTTINISNGKLVVVGGVNTYYFNIGSVSLSPSNPLNINLGLAPAGSNVVFNTNSNLTLNGAISLGAGLDSDAVLFNVFGNHTLQTSTATAAINGILLDPAGNIQVDATTLNGRIIGGDSTNLMSNSNTTVNQPAPAAPVPEPSTFASACFVVVIGLGYSWYRKRRAA
jgi:hypothetical protein